MKFIHPSDFGKVLSFEKDLEIARNKLAYVTGAAEGDPLEVRALMDSLETREALAIDSFKEPMILKYIASMELLLSVDIPNVFLKIDTRSS